MALGFIAKKDCREPDQGDIYCVHGSLTSKIENWEEKFNAQSSDEKHEGKILEAKVSSNQFDMLQMGSIKNYDFKTEKWTEFEIKSTKPSDTFAIKKEKGNYWTEKPILSTSISDITYDFKNMVKKANPTKLNSAVLENYSHIPQVVTRTLSYSLRFENY